MLNNPIVVKTAQNVDGVDSGSVSCIFLQGYSDGESMYGATIEGMDVMFLFMHEQAINVAYSQAGQVLATIEMEWDSNLKEYVTQAGH